MKKLRNILHIIIGVINTVYHLPNCCLFFFCVEISSSANGSLDAELGKRIGKAATTMTKLSSRVWENKKLTTQTKTTVYRACVLSTLLYGSEAWTTYAGQEKRLHTFHMRCLRRILSIHWTDKVTNNIVLERAGVPTIFTLLRQRRLRWLGHVRRMSDGRIPKDLLCGELDHGLWGVRSCVSRTHVSET